jgi:hypothetical protein
MKKIDLRGDRVHIYTTEYKGADALEDFIRVKNINKNGSILFQVFCGKGNQFYISGIIDDIFNVAPNATIIGATAQGEFFINHEKINRSVIALYEIEQKYFKSFFITIRNRNVYNCFTEMGEILFKNNIQNAILYAAKIPEEDSEPGTTKEYINSFNSGSQGTVNIAGGLAGKIDNPSDSYIFNGTTITNNGIMAGGFLSDDNFITNTSTQAYLFFRKYLSKDKDSLFLFNNNA